MLCILQMLRILQIESKTLHQQKDHSLHCSDLEPNPRYLRYARNLHFLTFAFAVHVCYIYVQVQLIMIRFIFMGKMLIIVYRVPVAESPPKIQICVS